MPSDPAFWFSEVSRTVETLNEFLQVRRVSPNNGRNVRPGLYVVVLDGEGTRVTAKHGPLRDQAAVQRVLRKIGYTS